MGWGTIRTNHLTVTKRGKKRVEFLKSRNISTSCVLGIELECRSVSWVHSRQEIGGSITVSPSGPPTLLTLYCLDCQTIIWSHRENVNTLPDKCCTSAEACLLLINTLVLISQVDLCDQTHTGLILLDQSEKPCLINSCLIYWIRKTQLVFLSRDVTNLIDNDWKFLSILLQRAGKTD